MTVQVIVIGFLMGLAFAAPPGAVTAETFRRGVRGGFRIALGVQLGSLIGDATFAVLALVGLATIAEMPGLQIALGAAGAMFLMYLAWTSISAIHLPDSIPPDVHRDGPSAFFTGLAISLTNPWAIAFWLSLGGVMASLGLVNASAQQMSIFFGSFMGGSALWAFALAFVIARLRHWIRPPIFRVISVICGMTLGAFGLAAASRVLATIFAT